MSRPAPDGPLDGRWSSFRSKSCTLIIQSLFEKRLGVTGSLGILDVRFQPQSITQTGLGEPNKVVILVFGTGYMPSFLRRHDVPYFSR
jgi:hypothetical protein